MAVAEAKTTDAKTRESVGEDIQKEIQELREDVAALARSIREYGDVGAREVRGRVGDMSDEAIAEALRVVKELRGRLDSAESQLEGKVREHPLGWLAGAVGIGLVFGMLFSRRD
jgi:ElaB/YqjD/DUF883 family membrane-anchored ribosome-binding protein